MSTEQACLRNLPLCRKPPGFSQGHGGSIWCKVLKLVAARAGISFLMPFFSRTPSSLALIYAMKTVVTVGTWSRRQDCKTSSSSKAIFSIWTHPSDRLTTSSPTAFFPGCPRTSGSICYRCIKLCCRPRASGTSVLTASRFGHDGAFCGRFSSRQQAIAKLMRNV